MSVEKIEKIKGILDGSIDECTVELGQYERMYPDTGTFTKGMFVFRYVEYVYSVSDEVWEKWMESEKEEPMPEAEFAELTIDIVGEEGITHDFNSFYVNSKDKVKGIEEAKKWLSQFKTDKELYDNCVEESGFSRSKGLEQKRVFNMLKSELPDGTDLESFIEGGFL